MTATAIHFLLNQTPVQTPSQPADAVLLDWLRQKAALTGCKAVCREGDCGACLVLIGQLSEGRLIYHPATACLVPVAAINGCHVVTIEGLSSAKPNPIQQALIDAGGVQCGFCSPGLVMALTGFFLNSHTSDENAAIDAVAGNLCRCTGYAGIKRAIQTLCRRFDLSQSPAEKRLSDLIHWQILPAGFGQNLTALLPAVDTDNATTSTDALYFAGGTDLLVQHSAELQTRPLCLLPPVTDETAIRLENDRCVIAATATMAQLQRSPLLQTLFPALIDDFQRLCSAPIRERATLGGNLANASPIADLAVFFLALNAELRLGDAQQQRDVALHHFFSSYKHTALQAGEQLLHLSFPLPTPGYFSFEKVCKRPYLDIASVNSTFAANLTADGMLETVSWSVGGVAPVPLYLAKSSAYLSGQPLNADTLFNAVTLAQSEIAPISDIRGSANYKRLLLRQLLLAHIFKLFPDRLTWSDCHDRF